MALTQVSQGRWNSFLKGGVAAQGLLHFKREDPRRASAERKGVCEYANSETGGVSEITRLAKQGRSETRLAKQSCLTTWFWSVDHAVGCFGGPGLALVILMCVCTSVRVRYKAHMNARMGCECVPACE